jgi:hypothetical protein
LRASADIGAWLRGLGLGQYKAAFHEAAIDAETLRELTDGDLEKLDVLVGQRERLLKSIAERGATDQPPRPPQILPERRSQGRRAQGGDEIPGVASGQGRVTFRWKRLPGAVAVRRSEIVAINEMSEASPARTEIVEAFVAVRQGYAPGDKGAAELPRHSHKRLSRSTREREPRRSIPISPNRPVSPNGEQSTSPVDENQLLDKPRRLTARRT